MTTEEDLDSLLDDALDDLAEVDKQHAIPTNPPKPTPKPAPTSTTSTTTTTTSSKPQNDKSEEELADHFASQMADILSKLQGGDLEKNIEEIIQKVGGLQIPEDNSNNGGEGSSAQTTASTTSTTSTSSNAEQEQADLEIMLSALSALDNDSNPESTASSITEKLKKIAENAKNITDNTDVGGEELENMIRDFQNNPEFQTVMEGMVNQMISKDVLYDPMKELREKYPKWLEDNRATLSDEDYKKYIEQYNIVQKICTVYESSENATPDQMQEVVQLMQDMAEYGQPPQDIIQELAPGVQIGADGVPVFPGAEGGDPANAGCSLM